MDISFPVENGKFNYRVCALLLSDNRILAMRDEVSPYYYLPGGRVKLGETAENAVLRELKEELSFTPRSIRPLWLAQSFFTEDVSRQRYHELCVYFLAEFSGAELLGRGSAFTLREGPHTHRFEWLDFDRLKDLYFYPEFLKTEIFHLPDRFTLRTEDEQNG